MSRIRIKEEPKPALGGGVIPEFEMILNERGERGLGWTCPKCGKVIVANPPNTLTIDRAEHLKWHEIND